MIEFSKKIMKIYKYFVTILGKNVQVLVALLMGLAPMDMEFVVFVSNFNAGRVLPRLEPKIIMLCFPVSIYCTNFNLGCN